MNRRPRIQVFVTGLIWSGLSALSFFYSHAPRRGWIFAGLAGVFMLSALFLPPVARAIHKVLSTVALGVVSVVTWTLLALAFYLLLFPLGLFLRMTGSLRTARTLRESSPSYWVDRRPEPVVAARYLRPF